MDPNGVCDDFCLVSLLDQFICEREECMCLTSPLHRRFLLLAGRLADLYPAQYVFEGGFVTLAIFFLVSSFGKSSSSSAYLQRTDPSPQLQSTTNTDSSSCEPLKASLRL